MRRREKANYPVYKVERSISVIMQENADKPILDKKQISILKKLSRLAFRLVRVRAIKNEASAKESAFKKNIDELLDELAETGVIGLARQAGPETSTELRRVEVIGREVADAMAMLDYLGKYSGEVVKSVQLPFDVMLKDHQKFKLALNYLMVLYGEEFSQKIGLDINISKLDALQKSYKLEDEPEGIWRYKPKTSRIDAKIITY